MGMRDLFDNVSLHLVQVLEQNRAKIQAQYRSFIDKDFVIYKGRQSQIPGYPAIEIVRGPVNSAWFATRAIDEKYNYYLDCSIKHASREVAGEFVTTLGRAVQLVLNDFRNLRPLIPGTINIRAADSFADSADPGFRRAQGERTSRVSWRCNIANIVNSPGGGNFIPC